MTDAVRLAERLAERFAERAERHDREASFPVQDMQDLKEAGLLGLMVPARLGGMGAGFEEYTRVAMALASGSGSTALAFNMHASVTGALAGVPDELARGLGAPDAFFETRDEILRRAAGGAVYGVAITEREAGSRLSALRTTYRAEDGGYRILGQKSVCTGAGHLDAYLVAARAADGTDDTPRLSYFLVPSGEGIEVRQDWDPLGMRATASHGLGLDVRVDAGALVGGVEGLVLLLANAMPQWLVASYAAVYVGVGQGALAEAVRYLGARVVAGSRGGLTGLPSVRARLGRADAEIEGARLAVEEAARLVDASPGEPDTNRAIFRAKLLAGDAAMRVASSLTEACGLGALQRGQALERMFRDARMGALMPPSSDVCANYLGGVALGLEPMTSQDPRPW
ncbi:MAG: acyl-CoA/acyl-ACP dehydrogenase [Actinomycetota bacterium]|nr:acyl-CoA/acyl-ACP dehydrogenase [Actinomycetota bacterium]